MPPLSKFAYTENLYFFLQIQIGPNFPFKFVLQVCTAGYGKTKLYVFTLLDIRWLAFPEECVALPDRGGRFSAFETCNNPKWWRQLGPLDRLGNCHPYSESVAVTVMFQFLDSTFSCSSSPVLKKELQRFWIVLRSLTMFLKPTQKFRPTKFLKTSRKLQK